MTAATAAPSQRHWAANAAISARLPYLMATSRFAHFLKVMARDKIGSFMEATDVEVWLNDHYRVQQRDLAPGGRLEIPLGVFVAAFGQNFDPKKQVPFGIEVTAVAADGKPVKIVWGKGRRR
mgnify:CR=1 FL=1